LRDFSVIAKFATTFNKSHDRFLIIEGKLKRIGGSKDGYWKILEG